MATDYTITITNGVPNPFSLPVSGGNKDTVSFVDGGGGPWYIVFQNPFKDHVINTANPGHAKMKLYGGASLGNCFYSIYAQDPTTRQRKPKPFLKAGGGGIIIDN